MNDTLIVIAEFSIGLAGFSGIVAVISHRPLKILQFRTRSMLQIAFTPGFVALAGLFFLRLGLDSETAVRVTSALLAIGAAVHFTWAIRTVNSLQKTGESGVDLRLTWYHSVATCVNVAAQCFNVLVVTDSGEAILVGGLILMLLSGAITFSSIVGVLLRDQSSSG